MKNSMIILLIYFIFGVYLVNSAFTFVPIPETVSNFDKWIYLVAGLLLFVSAFKFLKKTS